MSCNPRVFYYLAGPTPCSFFRIFLSFPSPFPSQHKLKRVLLGTRWEAPAYLPQGRPGRPHPGQNGGVFPYLTHHRGLRPMKCEWNKHVIWSNIFASQCVFHQLTFSSATRPVRGSLATVDMRHKWETLCGPGQPSVSQGQPTDGAGKIVP